MRLWLDDRRDPARFGHEDWFWVKDPDEAIGLFQYADVECASLDHDLGRDIPTGYDVMRWLEQHPEFYPKGGVRIHTGNSVGAKRMFQVIQKMEPERNYQTILQVWTQFVMKVRDE